MDVLNSQVWVFLCLIITLFSLIELCHGDVGMAAQYAPPYTPTACYGSDPTQFPTSNLFAAAGDGIWDNGASCGRQYLVGCISATEAGTCNPDQTVRVRIVDYAPTAISRSSSDGATIVLSQTAFQTIAKSTADMINIEFQQV